MATTQKEKNNTAKNSYGKHTWKFWVLVYVAVAVVVYGVIYLVFVHHGNSTSGSGYNW